MTGTRIARVDPDARTSVTPRRVRTIPDAPSRPGYGWLFLSGLALLAACLALRFRSDTLTSSAIAGVGNTVWLVALLSTMGCLWFLVTELVQKAAPHGDQDSRVLLLCLTLGLLMRLTQFGASPIYETDYLRYLWDGAVVSSDIDPYVHTPASIGSERILCSLHRGPAPNAGGRDACVLSDLARASDGLVDRISYRYVTTIYPPAAQAAFAMAYRIAPFSLDAWRGILLFSELLGVVILVGLLRAAGQHPLWSLIYWWNPLVILHIANGAHIEGLLLPLLLAALWAMACQRSAVAAVALAVATAVKLWPLLLLPGLLSASSDVRRNRRAAILAIALAGLLLWPQLHHLASNSGLTVFADEWVRNAFVFPWLKNGLGVVMSATYADHIARGLVAVVVLLLSLSHAVAGPADAAIWARRWGICVSALFLLGPTGYPWYFIGVLPLLCLWRPRPLHLLFATLPLYFALYIVKPPDHGLTLSNYVIAVEFLPAWAGISWGAWRRFIADENGKRDHRPVSRVGPVRCCLLETESEQLDGGPCKPPRTSP